MNNILEFAREKMNNGNYTCVIISSDKEYAFYERGVKPLLELLKTKNNFSEAVAADKVVGAGAAHLYVLLGVRALWANVISVCAEKILNKNGIEVFSKERVDNIVNREGNGICPIEAAVLDVENSQAAYKIIIDTLERIKEKKN